MQFDQARDRGRGEVAKIQRDLCSQPWRARPKQARTMIDLFEIDPVSNVLAQIEERLATVCASPRLSSPPGFRPTAYPISWLRAQLELTATEEQVLWVLIAHELSPIARQRIRELNTEQVADPTIDALRRVVYGSTPTPAAWRELGPDGRLRRLGLVERTDGGADIPLHRQLVRAAPRVLALAYGEIALDTEIAPFAQLADEAGAELAELELDPEIVAGIERVLEEARRSDRPDPEPSIDAGPEVRASHAVQARQAIDDRRSGHAWAESASPVDADLGAEGQGPKASRTIEARLSDHACPEFVRGCGDAEGEGLKASRAIEARVTAYFEIGDARVETTRSESEAASDVIEHDGIDDIDDIAASNVIPFPGMAAAGDGPRSRAGQPRELDLVIVAGGVGTGRRSLLTAAARAHGCQVLVIDAPQIARDRQVAARQLRLVARECRLFGLVPLLRGADALGASGDVPDRLDLLEAELAGLVLATATRAPARRWRRAPAMFELPLLTGAQRARLWARAVPVAAEDADLLATLYPMAPALIRAVGEASARARGREALQAHHVEAGVRAVLDDRLAGLATRVRVTQTWDDLVLPEDQLTSIIELLARIRQRRRVYEDWGFARKVGRGLGVTALFSGPPGTGKTMCAGLIARDLATEIYQVDTSKLVSKWIGETEKNLGALFDAAEAGHAILLFDEADALFGKRTDVKSSNDRHANQETNYLLQRLESFGGVCILTTNHDSALDAAFRRRLSVHVRFPMPEPEERERLWRAMLPAEAPAASEIKFEQLGRAYAMSGGHIRNAVLRAAFLAADQGCSIDSALLARAAQLECEAMGKVVLRGAL
jgi:hypothetical protein